jgi:excinuclease ABC subunit A
VIGVDFGLVIPTSARPCAAAPSSPADAGLEGVPGRPDEVRRRAGIPRDTAWSAAHAAQRDWVIDGTPHWNGKWNKQWYGVRRFFAYLESKAYKMHIRVLLSKYRSYTPCGTCGGARLKPRRCCGAWARPAPMRAARPQALPAGGRALDARAARSPARPGLHDLMQLPIDRLRASSTPAACPTLLDEALKLLLDEMRTRLKIPVRRGPALPDAGPAEPHAQRRRGAAHQPDHRAGHLAGQHLFVLDEPSIGLHPRDMNRIVEAMHRLRDAGNTLVVVEHDPAGDAGRRPRARHGPGPGRARRADRLRRHARGPARAADTLTGAYLGGAQARGPGLASRW